MTAPAARRMRVPAPADLPALLALRAQQDPAADAIVVDGVGSLTFADWHARANAVASGLLERGVRRGGRVALVFGAHDWADYAVSFCGVLAAGAVAVPLSDRLAPVEIGRILGHSQTVGVLRGRGVTLPEAARRRPGAGAPRPDAGTALPEAVAWATGVAEAEAGGGQPDVAVRRTDLAQILYTSGTTGRPKGVGATHANLAFGLVGDPRRRPLAHSRHAAHAFGIGTNAGQTMLLHALNARPAALTLPRFTPARFAKLLSDYAAGTVFVVPAMAIELLNARVLERFDTSAVTLLGSAAAALPPAVAGALAEAFGNATIVNYYTSTEAAPAQTSMLFDPARPGSVGRPASRGDVRIADEHGQPLPTGDTGEVWLRCPTVPRAYVGDREATEAVFRSGWVRMGDLGYLDADGYLYLVDRADDLITTGAYKVSSLQVEAALHEHPAVVEAAVVGIPHPVMGMAVAAAVVPGDPVSPADLRGFLAGRLAPYERPGRIVLLESLPRNHNGKVLKRERRERLAHDVT